MFKICKKSIFADLVTKVTKRVLLKRFYFCMDETLSLDLFLHLCHMKNSRGIKDRDSFVRMRNYFFTNSSELDNLQSYSTKPR